MVQCGFAWGNELCDERRLNKTFFRDFSESVMTEPDSPSPPSDVRMRGFAERTTVENALAWLDSVLPPLDALATEEVDLGDAMPRCRYAASVAVRPRGVRCR